MRVLFLIPKQAAPTLDGPFSKLFKDFVERCDFLESDWFNNLLNLSFSCLCKEPDRRPSAKELLRDPFIRKARPNGRLVELIDRYRRWRARQVTTSENDSEHEHEDGDDV